MHAVLCRCAPLRQCPIAGASKPYVLKLRVVLHISRAHKNIEYVDNFAIYRNISRKYGKIGICSDICEILGDLFTRAQRAGHQKHTTRSSGNNMRGFT